jgi:hypothetical protein
MCTCIDPPTKQKPGRGFNGVGLRWLMAAWLTGSLLFAHGCHGDEDNELFSACIDWITGK